MLTKLWIFKKLTPAKPRTGRLAAILTAALGLSLIAPAKAQLSVPNYTGCPNQIITVTANWPNVTITSLNLLIPNGGSATNGGNLQTNTTFTISHPGGLGPVTTNWTLTGTGLQGSSVVTSTIIFQLLIDPPPPLTFQNPTDYCPGGTATIITQSGGNYYTMVGPQTLGPFQTNVFIIPNLSAAHNGTYLVTSVGTCTMTGTTAINVAPNTQLTANSTSNVCQGQQVQLVGLMANGINWEWFGPSNSSIDQGNPVYSFFALPADGGVYTVRAEAVYGSTTCPKTATTLINVVATNPVSASASPSGLLCQNDKLTLQGVASGAVGYSWVGPCNFASSLSSPTISPVIPCNTGNYVVTALFTNNFVTCTTTAAVAVDIVATSPPNPVVPSAACQGDQNVQLSATGNGTLISGWVWYGPNFSSNLQNPKINGIQPDQSGPYVVTVIYRNAANTKTCAVSSLPQQLTVIQVNSISVIPPTPVCVPENANLSASSPGAVQYDWKGPNNANYSGANVTIYYATPASSGVYTVTAYFGSLLCPNSATTALTVNPVLNFSLIPRQMSCYNFSVGVQGPSGADSYTWTSSTGLVAYTKDILINSVQPKDAGTYTLSVSLGPCITRASSEIAVVTPIQFTLTPKSRSVCLGDTVIFEAGVTGGSENYAYTWNPPLYLDSPNGPYKVLVPKGTVQYNLLVHDVACAKHFTLAHTFQVEVKEAPTPSLNLQSVRACEPLCQFYDAGTAADAGITTYDFGGLMQYQGNVIHKCLDAGTYTLNVTTKGKNGCTGYYQYPYPIIVDPRPGSDILWSPNPATTTEEVTFRAESDYEPVTFQSWLFVGGKPAVIDTSYMGGGTDTSNDVRPVRRYETFGKYPVMLVTMNDHGCFDTVVKFIEVIDEMSVFIPDAFTPNGDGVNDNFSVKGQGMEEEGFIMDIFNRKGQIIFSTKDLEEPWDGTSKGSMCPDGVYTYKIRIVGMNGEGRKEYVGRVTLLK